MNRMTEEEALSRLAAYCSTAEHCRAEVIEKMQKWGLPYKEIDRVVDRLVAERYVDDERYCRAFVADKFRFAKWGKVKIGQALYMKKVPNEVYRKYLYEIDETEYLAVLTDLLAAKRKSIHAKDDYELNGKLIRFAISRGFEMNDIRRCIELSDEDECIY